MNGVTAFAPVTCVKVDVVVRVEVKQAQHTCTVFDVHSSLISIEVTDRAGPALPAAARRILRQARGHDSILLLETTCALLLPAMPFSGAQAVARRISPFLSSFACKVQVYHGTTALLVLQQLHEAGARPLTQEECDDPLSPAAPLTERAHQHQEEPRDADATPFPHLAFLTNYPAPRLLHLLPYDLACRYQCVPVGSERKKLTLATCRWLDDEVLAQLQMVTRREIFQVGCEVSIIEEVLRYWQRVQESLEHRGTRINTSKLCSSSSSSSR